MPGRVPDFFVIGAPKCGTSAVSEYLRVHPNVFFSTPKEPFFYSADYNHRNRVSRRSDYLALFAEAPSSVLLGEGSTWYLRSKLAVPRILEDNPDARFIVMLREPVAMLRSLHAHQLREMDENLEDFATAWSVQRERAWGRLLPHLCSDPKVLQYKRVCSFGEQLERLFAMVQPSKVLVHIFEEFVADPMVSYARTMAFLGLTPDGREDFPCVNQARDYNSRALNRFLSHFKGGWGRSYAGLKRAANRFGLRPGMWITQSNKRTALPRELDPEFEASLRQELASEIARVEQILGRRILAWHRAA